MTKFSGKESLNPEQLRAVTAPLGEKITVMAGAGTGKTSVLSNRMGFLLENNYTDLYHILAITFTNKSAKELKDRILCVAKKIGHNPSPQDIRSLWIGTFHGICHRILREQAKSGVIQKDFQIIDQDDQFRLVRRLVKDRQLDEVRYDPKRVQHRINLWKDRGMRAENITVDDKNRIDVELYRMYESECQKSFFFDFSELLIQVYELFQKNPEIKKQYTQQFLHVVVDEAQDMNGLQYELVKLWSESSQSVMIVGDDDQSIYGWRGAKPHYLREFSDEVIALKKNYRSSQKILTAANAVISYNQDRFAKELESSQDQDQGQSIIFYDAFDEFEEARYIAKQILSSSVPKEEIAILYRSNMQSRVLEDTMIQFGIPYQIHGGLRFLERAEIKDLLAYSKVIINVEDSVALERIINTPSRGIGHQTMLFIRDEAFRSHQTLWQTISSLSHQLPKRSAQMLQKFQQMILHIKQSIEPLSPHEQVAYIYEASGLMGKYEHHKNERNVNRNEHVQELIEAIRVYTTGLNDEQDPTTKTLSDFIAYTTLATQQESQQQEGHVQLMTIHGAKGLEFDEVFIPGMSEGIFPNPMCIDQFLEEERRLCYVGITRAKRKLTMIHARTRHHYGQKAAHLPSRFIKEIPHMLLSTLREERIQSSYLRNVIKKTENKIQDSAQTPWKAQQRVIHAKFGKGTITKVEASGDRIWIAFDSDGSVRCLMPNYASLQVISDP